MLSASLLASMLAALARPIPMAVPSSRPQGWARSDLVQRAADHVVVECERALRESFAAENDEANVVVRPFSDKSSITGVGGLETVVRLKVE